MKNAKSCVNADEKDVDALDFLAKELFLNEKEIIKSAKSEANGDIVVNVGLLNKARIHVIKRNKKESIFLYE